MRLRNAILTACAVLATMMVALAALPLNTAKNQSKPTYKANGEEASLSGTISFVGEPPKPLQIDVSSDEICEAINPESMTEDVVVTDGKLANVFVYARAGYPLDAYSFDVPSSEVTLQHKGCRYVPRVFGIQTQQTLKIVNSDPTTHNTHVFAKNNPEWNQSQAPGPMPLEQRFASPELFIRAKDNQHPWEKAYIGVLSHPFFAVSSDDGSYKIAGLPSGQYTIVAWHEKYGEQTAEVTVAGRDQKTLDFTFKAPEH